MSSLPVLITAEECNADELDRFLRSYFGAEKCDFLREHGAWQHQSNVNRFVIIKNECIAAYCAVMPAKIWAGESLNAYWWIDLYVHPDFRGQGLQRLFDEKVSKMGLILGVPNAEAAPIHRKHGWQVREDYSVMLLPIRPTKMPSVQRQKFKAVGILLEGLSRLYWAYIKRQKSRAYELYTDAESLADVYERFKGKYHETERSAAYIQWRYFDSPHRKEYRYWGIEGADGLEIVLISRNINGQLRLLDVFGNLDNAELLRELLLKAIQSNDLAQVTAIASNRAMKQALSSLWFLPLGKFRFCWISPDAQLMQRMRDGEFHWNLADSDSDLT